MLSENCKTLLSQSTCSSTEIYCRVFKHNMLMVQAGLVERQENNGVGSSTVKQIQSRRITAKERYYKKKILYYPNSIKVQISRLCLVRTLTEF